MERDSDFHPTKGRSAFSQAIAGVCSSSEVFIRVMCRPLYRFNHVFSVEF